MAPHVRNQCVSGNNRFDRANCTTCQCVPFDLIPLSHRFNVVRVLCAVMAASYTSDAFIAVMECQASGTNKNAES